MSPRRGKPMAAVEALRCNNGTNTQRTNQHSIKGSSKKEKMSAELATKGNGADMEISASENDEDSDYEEMIETIEEMKGGTR